DVCSSDLAAERPGMCLRLVEGVAMDDDLAAQPAHRLDLDGGRGARHYDDRARTHAPRRIGDALCMVAGRGTDHTAAAVGFTKTGELVVSAALIVREAGLHVPALQQHLATEPRRQLPHAVERYLDRRIVDRGIEDAADVVVHVACQAR